MYGKNDPEGHLVESTVGRFIYNQGIPQDLGFVDRTKDKYRLEVDFICGKKQLGQGFLCRVRAAVGEQDLAGAGFAQQTGLLQTAAGLPGGAVAAVEDLGVRPQPLQHRAHKGIVRAAQHQRRRGRIRRKPRLQVVRERGRVQLSPLDKLHQARTGQRNDLRPTGIGLHQMREFCLTQRGLGGHDEDLLARMPVRRGLERRLDADDRPVAIALPQRPDGCARGGVAGHDDGLAAVGPVHVLERCEREAADLLRRP